MRKFTKILFIISTFYLLYYCSNENNIDKYKELKNIIQSEIINQNSKESYYYDSRNENIFIYVDSTDVSKYLIDLDKDELIFSKKRLSNAEKSIKIKQLMSISQKLELLKIKAIFPGNKYFTVYTTIKSDSTHQEIINSDSIFEDIDYDINKGDYYFALINFKDTELDSTLIKKYKSQHGIRSFYKDWFFYRYQR